VDVAGLGPLTYQWLFNGVPIAGANSAVLTFNQAQPVQSGDYSVIVANSVGTVTSAVEQVTVIPVPSTPGSVDVSFDPTAGGQWAGLGGSEVSINALVRLDDGRWLVGGSFVGLNNRPRLHLARLHPSGSVDETFDTSVGPDGPVTRIAVQPNGQIVIVGGFTRIHTTPRRHIARMNADATLDPSFAPAVEGSIQAMAVQADGRVLIGGDFTGVNGVSRINLARLNSDGTLDTNFNPGTVLESPSACVYGLKLQPDGRILAAGWFFTDNQVRYVVRLQGDGSLDGSFQTAMTDWRWGFGGTTLALLSDGRMYVSGGQIARLNADGSLDTSFNDNPSTEWVNSGSLIQTMVVQADGKVVIGGAFDRVQGYTVNCLARLNPDGSVDPSFYQSPELPYFSIINAIEPTPDGRLLVGSGMRRDQNARNCLRLLSPGGWALDEFYVRPYGDDAMVEHIALAPSHQVVIAGAFASLNGVERPNLARLNSDGTLDHSFDPPPTNGQIKCLAVQPDGRVVAGHYFDDNGLVTCWLSRYNTDGSRDESFVTEISGKIYSVYALPDGKLLVGGWFQLPDGREHFVRLNADGSVDASFFARVILASDDYGVSAIAVQRDGKILIGGEIFSENLGAQGLLRLHPDGSPDAAFNGQIHLAGYPLIILVQLDDKILVPDGSSLLRLNPDGTPDGSFHPPADGFTPLALQANGQILGCGGLGLQRLNPDGSVDASFSAEPYPSGRVSTLVVQPDGQILAGGGFRSLNGIPFSALVRLNGSEPVVTPMPHPADLTSPTWTMSIHEVTAYGAAWRRGQTWPVSPNPIPIDYVTRAAYLWRNGECYELESNSVTAPLWWMTCAFNEAEGQGEREQLRALALPNAEGHVPPAYIPGEPVLVTIAVSPAPTSAACAVEDAFPAGWSVSAVSDGGELDGVNGRVKWGPFFDANPRLLTYQATPPPTAEGLTAFGGTASFDGASTVIAGSRQLQASARLRVSRGMQPGQMIVSLAGGSNARYLIETSLDLTAWETLISVTASEGRISIPVTVSSSERARFFRARRSD
jgi:uncharacterized delta-60 repeat protein